MANVSRKKSARHLRAIAIHEAGHAVVHWRLGVPFEEVSIIPDPNSASLGRVVVKHPRWYRPDADSYVSSPNHHRSRSHCQDCLVGLLAGHLAEARFRNRLPRRYSYTHDLENCFNEAVRWFGSMEATNAFVHLCWVIAKDMVENDRNWKAITAVAEALLERKQLDQDEVVEIIIAANRPADYKPVAIEDLTEDGSVDEDGTGRPTG